MATYRIRMTDTTGETLGTVEALSYESAAVTAARSFARLHGNAFSGAMRVTGDRGKSGCFRVTAPGPNRQAGEVALGTQFHVF